MKTIKRYITREYLLALFYCLLTFLMIFVLSDLFSHMGRFLRADTPFYLITLYYIFTVCQAAEFLIPACLLLATLYTLWQFTRHNELIAMRASGISFYRIMGPFLCVGLFFSVLTTVLKETVVPHANMWTREFQDVKFKKPEYKIIRDYPYANSDAHRQWRIDHFDVKHPNFLRGVKIIQERPDGTREEVMTADKAEYMDGQWWFYDVNIQKFDKTDNPLGLPSSPSSGPDRIYEAKHLDESPQDFLIASKMADWLSSRELLRYLQTHKSLPTNDIAVLKVDLFSRTALPWACLIATLFAIPVGAKSGRQGVLTNVILALFCLFAFYFVIQFGLILGKKQVLSPWLGAWLPNIVFLTAGLLMTRKIS